MTTLAGRTIAALRSEHDTLASTVPTLTAEQLTGPSGASEWTIADTLSHVGSGAEITLAGFRSATGDAEAPGDGFNQGVWDRWNAASPQEQASGSVESDEKLVSALESVPEDQHDVLKVKSFMPDPLPYASYAALRLSEVANHSWDVRAGIDPKAAVADESAQLLAENLTGGIGFLLGFVGKPAEAGVDAVVEISGTPYRIVLADKALLTTEPVPATATFNGPLEAAIRLIYGRLRPEHTPADVEVTGNVTLDQLRTVFPGF
ncbi:maleylpyruvate isomerase family mycothiol-dependent enzyme [Actinoplanes sp. NPDC026619]|uniref:maleylpyruvate isomerase family mycothiol-dependent enzyme n=1 Tax=Actinoplanes sp. NPDC026619 TaxID=3155798 RepID=UPI0033F50BD6